MMTIDLKSGRRIVVDFDENAAKRTRRAYKVRVETPAAARTIVADCIRGIYADDESEAAFMAILDYGLVLTKAERDTAAGQLI